MTLIEKLEKLTKNANVRAVAREAGISPASLYGHLSRRTSPGLDSIVKLAHTFNVSIDWMLDDSQTWPPIHKYWGEDAA